MGLSGMNGFMGRLADHLKEWREDYFLDGAFARKLLWLLAVVFLVLLLLGWYWSNEPKLFDVQQGLERYPAASGRQRYRVCVDQGCRNLAGKAPAVFSPTISRPPVCGSTICPAGNMAR